MRPVFFIRHNWDQPGEAKVIHDLFDARRAAIHYDNYPVGREFDERLYRGRGAKSSLRNLKKANGSEALIVASYLGIENKILVGRAVQGSLAVDTPILVPSKAPFQLKYVRIEKEVVVGLEDFPLLFLLQPPYSTMVTWHRGQRAVNLFYDNVRSAKRVDRLVDLDFLAPWQLEMLCEEWLRCNSHLSYKLYQTGKSMKWFDIVGVTPARTYLFAQVKNGGSKEHHDVFCDNLSKKKVPHLGFYFDRKRNLDSFGVVREDIQLVPIEDVLEFFKLRDASILANVIYGLEVK